MTDEKRKIDHKDIQIVQVIFLMITKIQCHFEISGIRKERYSHAVMIPDLITVTWQ